MTEKDPRDAAFEAARTDFIATRRALVLARRKATAAMHEEHRAQGRRVEADREQRAAEAEHQRACTAFDHVLGNSLVEVEEV